MTEPRHSRKAGWVRAGFLLAGMCVPLPAQKAGRPEPVRWSAGEVRPGGGQPAGTPLEVPVLAVVAPGWHLYALDEPEGGPAPLEFSLRSPVAALRSVGGDRPLRGPAAGGAGTLFYVGQVRFRLQFQLRPGEPAGRQGLPFQVRYQACNERLCLPPHTAELPVAVEVAAQ